MPQTVASCPVPSCPSPTPTSKRSVPRLGSQSLGRCPLQVAEIRVELELRDEILPRAQNIQSRLDRQTIETEEV